MTQSYKTIKKPSEGFYKEKGSKFLSFAYPVSSKEKVKALIDELKKQYYDARHHCFAYSIGFGNDVETRANDDGEPNHSAGDPIFGQIRSMNLTHVLVVVVRYFGGTKLGVSGLIHAYKTATEEALKTAEVITVEIKTNFTVTYPYDKTQSILRLVDEMKIEIVDQSFQERCEMRGRVQPDKVAELKKKLELMDLKLNL